MLSDVEQEDLVNRFVSSFACLGELTADEQLSPIAWQLVTDVADDCGFRHWRPLRAATPYACLSELYGKIPSPFPPLFERLVLSYRWAEVDLRVCRLLANPPGPDLRGLMLEITKDSALANTLLPAGYLQFGKGADVDYDPVCFDTRTKNGQGDYRIVKIDHEEILCNNRIKVVAEVAESCERLMMDTIKMASH